MPNLNSILGEFRHYGFSLHENIDDSIDLFYGKKPIAHWLQTVEKPDLKRLVRESCANFLKNMAGRE